MIDVKTRKPLAVLTDGTVWPYIRVTSDQLDDLRRLLDANQVRYWVHENFISFDGGPETTLVELGRGADASAVQTLLDQVR